MTPAQPSESEAIAMNRMILDMSPEAYHRHHALSKSGMDNLAQSPMHFKYRRENPEDQTDALRFGHAFHTLLLEPEQFKARVAIAPEVDRRTKVGKETWELFIQESAGKTYIKPTEYEQMLGMCKAIKAHPAASIVLAGKGQIEPSLFWTDPGTGVECRARPDWLRDDGLIVDLKTTINAHPDTFKKSMGNYRYHVQDAFYREAYFRVFGKPANGFVFIPVEKEPPHGVCVVMLGDEDVLLGEREAHRLLDVYEECLKTQKYPGYSTQIEEIRLPAWVAHQANQGEYNHV